MWAELSKTIFRSVIDGIHLMVHFKALQILPLGDVTMIGAVRVCGSLWQCCGWHMQEFCKNQQLSLTKVIKFQLQKEHFSSYAVIWRNTLSGINSLLLSGCVHKSILMRFPQRAMRGFWSLQHHVGGKLYNIEQFRCLWFNLIENKLTNMKMVSCIYV